jgi:nucleotidyltransferase/DNA polymerase involved in DNA repair
MSPSPRAVIHVEMSGKNISPVNYSRRMYAIIRRYTPDVAEGKVNECFADLTGLRTFFKMSYKDLAGKILQDLKKEIGVSFTIRVATVKAYEDARYANKKPRSISTFKELNKFFSTRTITTVRITQPLTLKYRKLTVPFLGKVS